MCTHQSRPKGRLPCFSGVGRETHKVILEHYTQMKNILINLSPAPTGFYPVR